MTIGMVYVAMLGVALVATVTDTRSGRIPNWLTFPVLALAPLVHVAFGGLRMGLSSLMGVVICGLVPLLFFKLGAMGGGDVKVFAALGALSGPQMGLEVQLASMTVAFLYGVALVVVRGGLAKMFVVSGRVAANLVLPRSRRYTVEPSEMTSVRIGGAIFAGTLLCVGHDAWMRGLAL
ncbi:MAG: A24 family peptidase [Myxococcales bacterium]|nr:A24 family peptidase [Myxococcales bacterium]